MGGELQKSALHVLRHAAGVAARTVGPGYACLLQIVGIDVVVANSSCGNELHAGAFEEGAVAVGAGADNEGVGIAHIGCRDGSSRQIAYFAEAFCKAVHEGYFVVDDEVQAFGHFIFAV